MSDSFWRPISVDCIDPDSFPLVSLYLKTGGNYILYKDEQRPFSTDDQRRLATSLTEFIYVRTGDLEKINSYLENNLTQLMSNTQLNSMAKGRILYQTTVNYVIDVFASPEQAANLERCRALIRHMMDYVAHDTHALDSLQSIIAHNLYIFAHSVQVTALNLLVHEKMFNLAQDELTDVGIGSLLHDFGMTFISGEVLDKCGPLSDEEYRNVKQHPRKAYDFLNHTGLFDEVALNIIRYHHERFDGRGYPSGLSGGAIPRSAQLAGICDVYSALTTERPYRRATPHSEALTLMRQEAQNGFFNPAFFDRFEEILNTAKGVTPHERDHLLTRPHPPRRKQH